MPLDFGFNAIPGASWKEVVETYSHLRLTKPEDKLPALSGIAYAYRERNGAELGQYLTGVWMRDLINQIYWHRRNNTDQTPTSYRAPSWSWAASDDHIKFLDLEVPSKSYGDTFWGGDIQFFEAEILSAICVTSTDNILRQVLRGSITMRTIAFSGRLSYFDRHKLYDQFGKLKFGIHSEEDSLDNRVIKDGIHAIALTGGQANFGLNLDFIPSKLQKPNLNAEGKASTDVLYAIICWARPNHERRKDDLYLATLLVLERCASAISNFRRIGISQTITRAFDIEIPMSDQFRMTTITIV